MRSIVDNSGHTRYLGNLGGSPKMKWASAEDVLEPMSDEEIKHIVDSMPGGRNPDWPYLGYTHDQDGIGQCNADATTSAMESQSIKQTGVYTPLCSGDLYHRINGGRDRGSLLEDGLLESQEGVGSIQHCGGTNLWRGSGFRPATSQQRKENAVLEVFQAPTFRHCITGVAKGFDLISGIMWYSNYTPGPDGWMPRGSGGAGGHAVHGYKPTYRVVGSGLELGIWHKNSWNKWGLAYNGIYGLCVFSERMYAGPVGGWWIVRSVTYKDNKNPPEPKL